MTPRENRAIWARIIGGGAAVLILTAAAIETLNYFSNGGI